MNKKYLNIIDSCFAHAKTSSWYNESDLFEWRRDKNSNTNEEIVITDLSAIDRVPNKKVYGWIIEPPNIEPTQYDFAKNNFHKFEKIFTYDKSLLEISNKFEFVPMSGCWIDVEDRKIHKKNKLLCAITSRKRMTSMHNFRHEIINKFPQIDSFGNGYKPIDKKIEVLKNYMFCVVVENQIMDFLFTEKIIDCLITGTIPIYYGCPSIGDFFNLDGIITFKTMNELETILTKISFDFYEERLDAIQENFFLSKNYVIPDNFIYNKINER